MSKAQHWTLNLVGGLCALLILVNLVLTLLNERSGAALLGTQNQLNRAQQVQTTLQNLAVRIAEAAKTEAPLRQLLTRHELKVNVEPSNPPKPAR